MKDHIFYKIHILQNNQKNEYQRLSDKINEKYFNLPEGYFQEKICLDAACGANGFVPMKLLKLGANFVDCFDYNYHHKKNLRKVLSKYKSKYKFYKQNISIADNLFYEKYDFVHCSGAIHHDKKYKTIIKNLSKYVKKNGYIFISSYGKGGLIRDVTNFLRKEIKKNKYLHKYIEKMSFKDFKNFIISTSKIHEVDPNKYQLEFEKFFNEDLLMTIKDRLLAESYLEIGYDEIKSILKRNSFTNFQNLSFYPKFNNLRKFLSPFYFYKKHNLSKILYGEGLPQIIAQKK